MELDESGFPQPTGELEELRADTLVLALGQEADLVPAATPCPTCTPRTAWSTVGPDLMSGHPGVFAGGDMVAGARTLTDAIGHGKKAARAIDAWLDGRTLDRPARHALATPEHLNTWYYADAPKSVRPRLEAARRTSTFDEVVGGLDESTALYEARRCLSCGNCFQCDNCFGVCPDNAVDEGRRGPRVPLRLRLLQGLRAVRPGVPLRGDRDGAREDLTPGRGRPGGGRGDRLPPARSPMDLRGATPWLSGRPGTADSRSNRHSAMRATDVRTASTASGLTEIEVMPSRTRCSAKAGRLDGAWPHSDDVIPAAGTPR